jgi:hypothetical protein
MVSVRYTTRWKNQNANIWLGGDFNLGGIEWDTYSIKNKAQNTKQCKQLLDICQNNYLYSSSVILGDL